MKQDTEQITQQIALVKVLGDKYRIRECHNMPDNVDGLCFPYDREISLRPLEELLDGDTNEENKKARWRELLRHELIHAFFSSSGLDVYSDDETLVQWLAIMFPLMQRAFEKVGCDKR